MAAISAKSSGKGTAKKFGTRYGRTVREKFSKVDALQKDTYVCPFCNYTKVKRVAMGIWQCRKCQAKFTSKAYTVTKTSIKAEDAEVPAADEE